MHQTRPYSSNHRTVDGFATEAERQWSVFNHLVGLLSLLDQTVLGLVGAIIMWRMKHEESPFLDDHGREAVNFQISLLIYWAIFAAFVLVTFGLGAVLTPVFLLAMVILRIVGGVRGAMAANRGEYFRYPMCIRLIK